MYSNSKKQRNIKEKNIKNEITKYQVVIVTEIIYRLIDENKKGSFAISVQGDYEVNNQYSRTLNNEKNLINDLADEIAEEIVNNIRVITNDT